MSDFKKNLLDLIVTELNRNVDALALWECGSAANGTSDQYSDIDLRIICSGSTDVIFELLESALNPVFKITHKLVEQNQFLEGYYQRVYFLEGAPKHFFLDIGVLSKVSKDTLEEFLDTERHGTPVVHFDKLGLIRPRKGSLPLLKQKQKLRFIEIEQVFPVYKTEVLKELDRGHSIDALSFYFGGMIKPLVELMGMIHRPFRFDFGLRYLHKTFPEKDQKAIEKLLYVSSVNDLRDRVSEAEELFNETRLKVIEMLNLD